MVEVIGGIISSVFAGGATGLLGVIAQRYADYKNRQLDIDAQKARQDHEVDLRVADAKIMAQEWAGRVQVAEAEAAGREAVADAAAFEASYKLEPGQYSAGQKLTEKQKWVVVILDFIRGVIRPGLTIYLCALTTMIYNEVSRTVGVLTADQAFEINLLVVKTVLYLFTTTTLWYFGTRNKGNPNGR